MRLSEAPPMVTAPDALAVYVPAVLLLMVSVQVSTLPLTVGEPQLEVLVVRPLVGETEALMAPKLTGVALPGSAVNVTVKTCWCPTSLSAFCGVMVMKAST